MMKQYKINEEQCFPPKKKINFDTILFILLFIVYPLIIGIYNLEKQSWIWVIPLIGLGPTVIQIIKDYLTNKKNKKNLLHNYSITFEDHTILQKIPVLNNSFINSQPVPIIKSINYDHITQIKKTGNGAFIIKAKEKEKLNLISISVHMENYDSLEKELAEIHPITKASSLEETFTIPKDGFKKFKTYFLSRMIPGVLVMILLLIALLYGPKTSTDWVVLALIFVPISIGLIWGFSKMLSNYKRMYEDYRFTIEEEVLIQEQKGVLSIIPINEITKIKKSLEGNFLIMGKQGLWQMMVIHAQINRKEVLERKLNSMVPITQSKFLEWGGIRKN